MPDKNNKKVGFFDTESNGLLADATTLWCAVISNLSDGSVFVWDINDPGGISGLLDELASYDVLIGHNCIAHDFPLLRKLYGWEYHGEKIDTLLMSRTQRPSRKAPAGSSARPNSVEAWGIRLGHPKVANEVWDHYHPLMLQRCKEDVAIQRQVWEALQSEGRGEGWVKAHKLNNKLFELLQRQEEYGWTIDLGRLDRNLRVLNSWITRIDRAVASHLPLVTEPLETKKEGEYGFISRPFLKSGQLSKAVLEYYGEDIDPSLIAGPFCRVAFRPVDLDSNAETKAFLLKAGWIPKEWNENDAGQRTSAKFAKDDPFEGIQGSLGRLIAKRVLCRHRIGQLEGWRNAIRPDGRIATPVGGVASTGRLTHKVVVNVPNPNSKAFFAKYMRMVFVPRKGWVQVGVDSKGNQARQLAARMGDPEFTVWALKDKKRDGTDLHEYNQKLCGDIPRSRAKNFFYGFIFGARAPKIAEQIKDTVAVAQGLIDTYLERLPRLKVLIDELTKFWRATAEKYYSKSWGRWVYKNGYIIGLDGRPILVDSEHKILCYALQSDEAIQMGAAYVRFHMEMERAGYRLGVDFGTLIWMHDEIQFECKPEIAEKAAQIACAAITWAGEFYKIACPHEGDYKIGNNWNETH